MTRRRAFRAFTVGGYAAHWLALCASLKPRTRKEYEQKLAKHILPALGARRLVDVNRGHVRKLLAAKLQAGLSKNSVRLIHATLRAMLAAAVEDEIIKSNPAAGVGRSLHIAQSKTERTESIKAMTREQLALLLERANVPARPLFWLMSRTGIRLGEALGLQWGDVDLASGTLRVARAIGKDGKVQTPKSGHGRTVDLGPGARDAISAAKQVWLVRTKKFGEVQNPTGATYVFYGITTTGAQAAFRAARDAAGLPKHFTPHSLRHTYASILLAEGVSPAYVQEQLGHSSIELTVGTYGRWLRKKAPGALDLLEAKA